MQVSFYYQTFSVNDAHKYNFGHSPITTGYYFYQHGDYVYFEMTKNGIVIGLERSLCSVTQLCEQIFLEREIVKCFTVTHMNEGSQ